MEKFLISVSRAVTVLHSLGMAVSLSAAPGLVGVGMKKKPRQSES